MEQIAKRAEAGLTVLDGLAMQARMFTENVTLNMLQLGRVFIQAKELVQHGQWEKWVRDNSGMSERQAQTLMQAYRRFGERPAFHGLEKSKLFKMLALPDGTEEQFVQEHDVAAMSSREIEAAVRRAREDAQGEIEAERSRRIAAEERAQELANRPPEIPADIMDTLRQKDAEISRYRDECERVASLSRDVLEEKNSLTRELSAVQRELKETEEMLRESQEGYDRMQTELLNAQSTLAKGDAERVISEQLTAEDFAAAVRQFIGSVAQMPFMGKTFAAMQHNEVQQYDELLSTVEDWAKRARTALNMIDGGAIA